MKFHNNVYFDPTTDPRFLDIGLTPLEARDVYEYCKRYTNVRDTLDDIIQEALIALYAAFKAQKEKGRVIKYRRTFIYRVVRNALNVRIVRPDKKDLIYRCVNYFETPIIVEKLVAGAVYDEISIEFLSAFVIQVEF